MPFDVFGDFGFVGGDNTTANPYQDRQATINYYCEVSPSKAAKELVSLLGAPGLVQLAAAPGGGAPGFSSTMTVWPQVSSVTNLPVRGSWVLSGSTQALVVIANTCYLATLSGLSSTQFPTVSLAPVGTLSTSVGPVSIRDDGLGGYAVIVDGPYGYTYSIGSQIFATITDPNFVGATRVAFIDGFWIFSKPNSQTFYTNAPVYGITFNASFFANKDASTDLLMGLMESKEELWLIGERTTEIWYNAGGQYFPFQRLTGTMLQVGCKATYSIARFSSEMQDGLIWFGRSDRGENVIVKTRGFAAEVVSTPAVADAIAKYPVTSDAIGYTYQEDTHEFYVLIFPTADRTWVYDASVPIEYAWSQRLSYDPYSATFHRHRSNCYMNFGGMRIVGDYQNGALYQLTRNAYTDAGWPLVARRRAPHVWNKQTRQRTFSGDLQLEFAPGVGTASGMGSSPVANLRISRDGGTTFGQQWPRALGAQGQYRTRTIWRRLSWARDTVFEVEVMDPVNRDIVGATLRSWSQTS